MKGKGVIVKREWVEDCHSRRTRLSCSPYSLTPDLHQEDSDEEIFEEAVGTNTLNSVR